MKAKREERKRSEDGWTDKVERNERANMEKCQRAGYASGIYRCFPLHIHMHMYVHMCIHICIHMCIRLFAPFLPLHSCLIAINLDNDGF